MCPALRGSNVSYAGDTHFPKHSLEYSLNFWSQSKKKKEHLAPRVAIYISAMPSHRITAINVQVDAATREEPLTDPTWMLCRPYAFLPPGKPGDRCHLAPMDL